MSESQVNVFVRPEAEAYIVTAEGRVDSTNAHELDATLSQLISDGNKDLVLDLAKITYMSSAGLRAIVSALRSAKRRNGDVRIGAASERVVEVFSLAGLTPLFQMFDDVETAVNSFK